MWDLTYTQQNYGMNDLILTCSITSKEYQEKHLENP